MPVDIGRISGIMLKDNLERLGVPLSFENTLLHLDVNTGQVGIKTTGPTTDFDVVGTVRTTDLSSTFSLSNGNTTLDTSRFTTVLGNLNFTAAVSIDAPAIRTTDIDINDNIISTYTTNTNLEFRPTGTLEVYSDLNITGGLTATGNITLDGEVIFGNSSADNVTFGSDVNSNIIPNADVTYGLGANSSTRWAELHTKYVNGQLLEATSLNLPEGINLALRPGKTWFVDTNGTDTNVGNHQSGAFASIQRAITEAESGDEIYVFAGEYTEAFPIVVPQGVSIKGAGVRATVVKPSVLTQDNDAFLLNGESTVSDLTVKDFYYNAINDTGYAFRYAPNTVVSTRSPYVQNVSVITSGSIVTADDPRGYDAGDAGRGILVDGADVASTVASPSMLFHSVTLITPGVDAVTMTNGVRVEWLNSFTYFAARGLYAVQGTGRTGPSGTEYGAEIRSIGSANVYGNYGTVADGADTLMYLINYNFGYIGSGKDASNDRSLAVQSNETVELNSGKIYYQSQDHAGNFRIGDAFFVDFDNGTTSFDTSNIDFTGLTNLTITTGSQQTVINADYITTGNYRFRDNSIETLAGAVIVSAASGTINLTQDVNISKDLAVTGSVNYDGSLTFGNLATDTISFATPLDQALVPDVTETVNLGSSTVVWNNVWAIEAHIDDVAVLNNAVSATTLNTNLQLQATGSGIVNIKDSAVFDNKLDVVSHSYLKSISITGTVTHTGNTLQTGEKTTTGDADISTLITVNTDAIFADIEIINNALYTKHNNLDLLLSAAGSGTVRIPSSRLYIEQDLTIVGTSGVGTINATSSQVTANRFYTGDISLEDNIVTTNTANSNLELYGNNNGGVLLETTKLTANTLSTTDDINTVPGSANQLILDTTAALKVPAGTSTDRLIKAQGDLRFNTTDNTYEGFDGAASRGFGGVFSADRLTSVKASKTSNVLNFVTGNTLSMDITASRVRLSGLYVDALQFDGSTVQSINTDLTFSPNGTGLNIIESVTFAGSDLQNDNALTALTFAGTNNGYLKLDGTGGFVIPYGNNASRPLTPEVGDTRYNTEQGYIEVWDGTQYNSAAGVGESVTSQFMQEETDLWSLILG